MGSHSLGGFVPSPHPAGQGWNSRPRHCCRCWASPRKPGEVGGGIKGGDVYRKERPIVVGYVPRRKSRDFWNYSGAVLTLGCTGPVPSLNDHSLRGTFTKSLSKIICADGWQMFVINMKIKVMCLLSTFQSSQLQRSRSLLGNWVRNQHWFNWIICKLTYK